MDWAIMLGLGRIGEGVECTCSYDDISSMDDGGVIDLEGITPISSYDDNLSILTKVLKHNDIGLNIHRRLLEVIYKTLVYGWENKKLRFNYEAFFSIENHKLAYLCLNNRVILYNRPSQWCGGYYMDVAWLSKEIKNSGSYYSGHTIKLECE